MRQVQNRRLLAGSTSKVVHAITQAIGNTRNYMCARSGLAESQPVASVPVQTAHLPRIKISMPVDPDRCAFGSCCAPIQPASVHMRGNR